MDIFGTVHFSFVESEVDVIFCGVGVYICKSILFGSLSFLGSVLFSLFACALNNVLIICTGRFGHECIDIVTVKPCLHKAPM